MYPSSSANLAPQPWVSREHRKDSLFNRLHKRNQSLKRHSRHDGVDGRETPGSQSEGGHDAQERGPNLALITWS